MIDTCIFDMDGTTVNSIDSIAYFANTALNKFGYDSIDSDKYKYFVGNGAKTLVKRMAEFSCVDEITEQKILEMYNKSYDDDFMYLTRPYDGIVEMLENLKKLGIKTAIVSNKPNSTAVKISEELFGRKLIDDCVGGKDGIPLKPEPQMVLNVVEKLNTDISRCLYIGDTKTDMLTAKNSGITSIGVLWGFRDRSELEENGANYVVEKPCEIVSILKNLNSEELS